MHVGLQLYLSSTCLYGLYKKQTLEGFLYGPLISARDFTMGMREIILKYRVHDYLKSGLAWLNRNKWRTFLTYFVATGIRSASRNFLVRTALKHLYGYKHSSKLCEGGIRYIESELTIRLRLFAVGWYLEPHYWLGL